MEATNVPVTNRILIAEDEARLAGFIKKGLGKNGFFTGVADNGQDALEMALGKDYGLLLLDLGLPIQDGWSVLKELRRQNCDIPVIIITARSDDENHRQAMAWGANDYVTKPFSFKDLLTRIQLHLSNQHADN